MFTFLKAQTASIGATFIDYLVTVMAVELLGSWYVLANMLGTVSGGITHFTLGRNWVFQSESAEVTSQAFRYFLIWCGSLSLNALGVYLITHYGGISYIISKAITSVTVGIGYNYVLQKSFVFK
jgi:putative flippase GtrA